VPLRVSAAGAERAPAKVNLTLRVIGRRADGYHEIESLVVFAGVADTLTFDSGAPLGLTVGGPTAEASGAVDDNLVLRAARALADRVDGIRFGRFGLSKRLPVAAGIGGGSSDAAAALRLLARANGISIDDPRLYEAARVTGADVPVCLDPRPRIMRGIGEILSAPIDLPRLPAIMVNPGVAVPTRDVFAALGHQPQPAGQPVADTDSARSSLDDLASQGTPTIGTVIAALTEGRNDLEPPALALQPVIATVLDALRTLKDCRLARMSGSGATCFALFGSHRAASAGAIALRTRHPNWWVRATTLGA
jgi:4-diphosphocytidyl-2-C-methyl-D-erythritol kinase